MKTLWASVAVLAVLTSAAVAETRYDRNIEKAAAEIVAGKIGDIRGGFSFDAKPAFVVRPDAVKTGSIATPDMTVSADPWRDGLAPAVEDTASRTFF
jgi:hypothetical protein